MDLNIPSYFKNDKKHYENILFNILLGEMELVTLDFVWKSEGWEIANENYFWEIEMYLLVGPKHGVNDRFEKEWKTNMVESQPFL